jgi:class 3 adenylate cyclase/general stress protein 26
MSADNLLRLARETVNAVTTCLAITIDGNGDANARAINTSKLTDELTVRFMTDRRTRKCGEIARTGRMTLVYFHEAGGAYVTLIGRAKIIDDVTVKQAIWQPDSFQWHPGGPNDPNVVLVEFAAERIETWNTPGESSRMIRPKGYGRLCWPATRRAGATPVQPSKRCSIPDDANLSDFVTTMLDAANPQKTIAELQRQLDERTAERDESLQRETATAEVLQVINSSPGDVAPVFDAMLEKAMRLCEAAFGQLGIFDGERFHTAATRGVPAAFAEYRRSNPQNYGPGTTPFRILAGDRVIRTDDLKAEPVYQSGEPNRRAIVDLGGARSNLAVALRKDDAVLGFIQIYRQEVRSFPDKQVALLENFAAQAVIAMENARLLGELRARTEEIAGWNRELEARVATQLAEIERTGRLRRFLAPQLADLIVAQGDESILESHRREIVVVFCDLRGFTRFAERAEPEEVMTLLKDFHAAMGPIVARYEGTIDHYGGDGIMVFFNYPVPTPDPARRAIDMAVAMRAAAQDLLRSWRRHGHDIGFGIGISQGYATLGQIGFAERMDYTAIGTVTNLAARLCAEAQDGQILVSSRVATAIEDSAELEEIGDLALKGLSQAVAVYNVAQ